MRSPQSYCFVLFSCFLLTQVSESAQMEDLGRTVRGHLSTLYSLRGRLSLSGSSASSSSTTPGSISSSPTSAPPPLQEGPVPQSSPLILRALQGIPNPNPIPYHPSSNSNSNNKRSRLLRSRSKKVWEKYPTSFKIDSYISSPTRNSLITEEPPTYVVSEPVNSSALPSEPNNFSDVQSQFVEGSKGLTTLDLSPIQTLSAGLNHAITSVLTQKLMNILDRDVPEGLFIPMKHLVATGNGMIELWDRRKRGRDGKGPGLVETLGFGIDKLKRYREGIESIRPEDPVANMTSPALTLIQGLVTMKRLTNRVLGYDTSGETTTAIQSRAGYDFGHGGGYGQYVSYGGGGGMYGGLDPFSLLAALAFGAFLLQLLLTLLSTSSRSLNVVDLNTPLMMSDFHLPTNLMTSPDKLFGTPTERQKRSIYSGDGDDEYGLAFDTLLDKLDNVYKSYSIIERKPKCVRIQLCRLAVEEEEDGETGSTTILSRLVMYGIGHLAKDREALQFVDQIKSRVEKGEEIDCSKVVGEDCGQIQDL